MNCMKIVFYKSLLKGAPHLTPTERIIYSFLVSKSITYIDEVFDKDGLCLNMSDLDDILSTDEYIGLYPISFTRLSDELNISLRISFYSLKRLRDCNYIKGNSIYVNKSLIESGYFELSDDKRLKGELLIFYSYLKHKAERYGGYIDTFRYKLAEEMGSTKIAVTKLLNRLYKLSLAKRLENNKLMIL